jgi:hypothetical protein
MNKANPFPILLALCCLAVNICHAQNTDTAKSHLKYTAQPYFIITAGTEINAFFNDKPLSLSSISEFNDYVQRNAKNLKDSRVVVTGKPKNGTFDEVIKTLKRYRIKNISVNSKD